MTLDQGLAFGLMGATIGFFLWGRFAYDAVALGALLAGVLIGVIPADKAFEGLSDDVVVIVAAALIISQAVAKSGAVETLMRRDCRTQFPSKLSSFRVSPKPLFQSWLQMTFPF